MFGGNGKGKGKVKGEGKVDAYPRLDATNWKEWVTKSAWERFYRAYDKSSFPSSFLLNSETGKILK